MQLIAMNTMMQPNTGMPKNRMTTCLNNGNSLLATFLKRVTAFSRKTFLPFGILMTFLLSGVAAMAQCPSQIEGSVLTASTNPVCSGQPSSINISVFVSPGTSGTFSGSFTNGRTFNGLAPTANTIKPTYTFTNNTTANTTEYFELATLTFTTSGNVTCNATSMTGNTTITIQPVADLNASPNIPPVLCNNSGVSITVSNPNGVGGTYNRSTNYNGAGHTATASATGQAYGTFTDALTNNTTLPITVVYTFTPVSPGSGCVGTPVNVSVVINPNPTIVCPANKTQSTDNNVCTAVVNGINPVSFAPATCNGTAPTISYTLSGATTTASPVAGSASGATFNKGITTVTYTIKDGANNTGTCSFTVTVNDTQGPTFTNTLQADMTLNSSSDGTGNCGAVFTYAPYTATDNCGGTVTITYSKASGTSFSVGTTTVTVTATDNASPANITTDQFTVTVVDDENPTITCPGNMTTNNSTAPNDCGASVTFAASASDNCSTVVTYTIPGNPNPVVITSPYTFPVGITTVTATATDPAGHTAQCTFNVTVNNTTGNLYVNDGSTTGDTYTTGIGNDATGNGTRCKPYATITKAISVAATNNTIFVDAGDYAENVVVNKQLTILGPNANTNPNAGTRVAEATVRPATVATSAEGSTSGTIFRLGSNSGHIDITIKGFTIDGTNANLTGGRTLNGVNIKTGAGITNSVGSFDTNPGGYDVKMIVQNNIIQNLERYGVLADGVPATTPIAGTDVRFNKIDNLPSGNNFGGGRGRGIAFEENHYGMASGNVMTRVNVGWQDDNFYLASPGAGTVVSNNNIKSYHRGIFHNLQYQGATNATISNNTLAVETSGDFPASTSNFGVEVASVQTAVGATVSGNNVSGQVFGILLWNNPTTSTINVTGGTLTNNTNAIYATNVDPQFGDGASSTYIIGGVTVTGGLNGIYVNDSSSLVNNVTVAVTIQNSTAINGTADGLVLSGAGATASFTGATPASFAASNAKYILLRSNGTDAPAAGITATAVTFNGQTGTTASPAQNFAIEDKIDHKIDSLPLGFVTVKANNAFVTDIAPLAPTATNNDYTRVRNGILAASNGFTINHDGTFNWVETNAAAAWALGNDGVANTADDYSILVPNNLNSVTFTTPAAVTPATIQGPGDLPNANLEGVLVFDGTFNQGWTISNMKFQDFDLSIGMFDGGGPDAFDNTTITNNAFRIPKDLNSNAAPADANQNIGIHYSFGSNQTISNNTFEVDGTGVSNGTTNLSTSIVIQSNTSGGATIYDGLQITGNTITVTGVPAASPNQSVIRGIWENSQSTGAAINISSNKFSNTDAGNTAPLNRQTAFWVTSNSDASKKVEYKNNEVSGYRDGIAWLGGLFTGNGAPDYNTGETPTEIMNNKFDGVQFGVVVRKSGTSSNAGSPAIVNYNSFTNTPTASGGYAISNEASGTTNATCNWYGTTSANAIVPMINGLVTYTPYLLDGTDNDLAARGFQTTAACSGTPVVASATTTPQVCSGNGSIIVTFSGGTSPYTITYTNGAAVSGSQSGVTTSPYTISNIPAGNYTVTVTDANGSFATTPATITYNPVTNTNTGISYTTIQNAIDAAATTTGHTLQVCAGRYAELITVSKSLTILGPNASVIPCSGTRVAEAVILPPSSQPFYDGTTEVRMMQITAGNVTIKGLTFDGDNAAISGGTASDTADINAADGIDVYADVQNITIQNNIFKNLNETGVQAFPSGSVTLQNNTISNNQLVNIAGNFSAAYPFSGYGIGVLVYNNFYAAVNNNCMTNARIGVQTGNFNLAGSPASISNNQIESKSLGVWYNLHYQSASNWTISGNNLTTRAGATTNTGVFISSIQSGVSGTITNNNVTGAKWGVELWNNPTTNPINISGGTLTNCETGVFANNFDSYASDGETSSYTVSGINVTSNVANNIGIHVKDNSANTNNATTTVQIQNSTIGSTAASSTGLLVTGGGAFASFTGAGSPAAFTGQSKYITLIGNGTDAPAAGITATAVTFNGQTGTTASPAQNFAIEDKIDHKIDSLPLGFVTVKANNAFVTDIAPLAPTATNNDYTRVRNGILAASNGFTINHDGTFNWVETNAAAAWALGNDGVANTADDYSILVPNNLNSVTFTTPAAVTPATIQGPGDLPNANLEGVLVFDGTFNQGWTISNMKFQDFDLSIGMFDGGGPDAFDNTTITNNAFRIPKDLNSNAAPADANQNIGIHYSFGSNQTISNNTFEVDGTGVSNGTTNLSTSIVIQSNTSGGAVIYDGLKIKDNTITVTGVPAAAPNQSVIRGIWENSQSTGAAIEISGNKFSNTAAGNTAPLNRQTAFWVTSNSDASKKVEYKNNEVSGYRDGIAWLGGLFTGNGAPDYNTGETPTEIMNNKFDGVQFGVVVRKSGTSSNAGSPAIVNYNSFTNTPTASGGYAISNEASGTTNATCNWYGSTDLSMVVPQISGPVTYIPYLNNGIDNDLTTRGFQTTAACVSPTKLYVNDGSSASGDYTTAAGNDATGNGSTTAPYATINKAISVAKSADTIFVDAGSYYEEVVVNKEVTIKGLDSSKTIVYPATSNPVGSGGTLGGNNIFLVRANNVTIRDLTANGNNPNIGGNVDARNGIVTDFNSGDYTNLVVHHTTVKNIYYRGIYSTYGSTPGNKFNFHHNTVMNVQGDAGSIAIFNFGNSGIIDSNKVTNANDGIVANQSTGTIFSNNTTTGIGIHTDNNGGSGGTTDTLKNNTVSNVSSANGYGILVFLPSRNVIVEENTITGSYIAIGNVGSGTTGVTPIFRRNTIDDQNIANSTGVFQTTSIPGFGPSNVSGTYLNNFIRNNQQGFYLKQESGFTSTIVANQNSITGNSTSVAIAVGPDGAGTLTNNFSCNWYGGSAPVVTGGSLNYQPTLINGMDNEPATPGFQPVPGSCSNCATPDVIAPTITLKSSPTVFLTAANTYTVQLSDVLQSVTDNCDPNPSVTLSTLNANCANLGSGGSGTPHQPFVATNATGNQDYTGEQGTDFRVNATNGIVITQLGAFDHQSNGLMGTQPDGNGGFGIRVAIFNKATHAIVPGLDAVISGNGDAFANNYRYKNIAAVTLPTGNYVVIAKGYNPNELNGNSYLGGGPYPQGDDAGGAISYPDSVFYDTDAAGFTYPANAQYTGAPTVLKGATFTYALNQSNMVTVTATDVSGNQSQMSTSVTVVDTFYTLTTKDITVALNSSGQATIQPADVFSSLKNNCGIDVTSTLQVSPSNFDCSNIGGFTLSAPHQPFIANSSTGNQDYTGEQGTDFRVNATNGIVVTQLGAFDHQSNGLMGTQPDGNGGFGIRVAIFSKATHAIVPGLDAVITGTGDASAGNYRYKNVTAVTLPAGNYVVIAKGYNPNELNGNSYLGGGPYPQGDDAGGAISYPDSVFYDTDAAGFTYPANAQYTGAPTVLKGATFTYKTQTAAGTAVVTLTATDVYGHQKQATANVSVADNTGPVITTKNITLALDATGHASIQPGDVLQSPITDNCNVNTASITVSPNSFSCTDYSSGSGSSIRHQPFIANNATGNQDYTGEQGTDFRVNASNGIVITQLGAFDHQSNGLMGTQPDGNGGFGIRVAIFNKATHAIVPGLDAVITGNGDASAGNYRYKNIAAVTLPAGNYIVIAKGYNPNELNGNSYLGGGPYPQGDDAGGAISYPDSVFYDTDAAGFTYPANAQYTGAPTVLKGATFTYALNVSNNKIVTVSATDTHGNVSQQTAVVTLTDPMGACTAQPVMAYAAKSGQTAVPVVVDNATMSIKVYPNPSSGQFTVQLYNLKATKVSLQIMDANGQVVVQKEATLSSKTPSLSIPVDISKHASGIYLIKVISADGIQTAKVVVSR